MQYFTKNALLLAAQWKLKLNVNLPKPATSLVMSPLLVKDNSTVSCHIFYFLAAKISLQQGVFFNVIFF